MNNTAKTIMALAEDFATAYAAANTMQSMQSDDERLERARKALEAEVSGLFEEIPPRLDDQTLALIANLAAVVRVQNGNRHPDTTALLDHAQQVLDASTTAAAPTDAEPDESKPTSRRDLERVLTEWNDTTGALPTRGGWIHEVLGMMQDAWDVASAQAVPPVAPTELDLWYLQDTRSYVGNDVLWWAQGGNGYTTDVSKAQAYNREDAFRQAAMRGCDRAWPKVYIDGKTRPAVDFQYIDHDTALKGNAS